MNVKMPIALPKRNDNRRKYKRYNLSDFVMQVHTVKRMKYVTENFHQLSIMLLSLRLPKAGFMQTFKMQLLLLKLYPSLERTDQTLKR